MLTSYELLSTVLRTTQMGQTGIRAVMPCAINPKLQQQLSKQLCEYDAIEKEAQSIAQRRGWEMRDVPLMVKSMSKSMAQARLMGGRKDSKIAGMMIQGNTRGMITGLKNLHRSSHSDSAVEALANRLLETENQNIQATKNFL